MAFEPLTPERRRAMTRQHLLDAAAIVFARSGFHGSTLDEVASTAGFTKGAVYSNFKSKDDLFIELVNHRMEQQFAVTSEVMDSGRDEEAQVPRMLDLIRSGKLFWDDDWTTLYLEFLLYARRNPEAREKLAAIAERTRALVGQLYQEQEVAGSTPRYPIRELAEVSLALFNGLAIDRLVDPDSVSDETLDTAFTLLAQGVDHAWEER